MRIAIYIICVLYFIVSLIGSAWQNRTIGWQQAKIRLSCKLISSQEAYIAELENRLADKYNRAVTITAYTARSRECDASPGKTAMMAKPMPGRTIAVSRDLFDDGWTFGRSVYIAGLGVFKVEDLMHGKHSLRIDVLMGTVKEAREFGKKSGRAILIADRQG